jgi:predicted Holliday junction resolvase-like endonuclease|tara:strand:+ start:287 stop:766 length:480 start_codon:yes stop_codon:yes gene_type:complete
MIELFTITILLPTAFIIIIIFWFLITRIGKLHDEKIELFQKIKSMDEEKEVAINNARKDSLKRQRAIIKGDISEIIAPWSMTVVNSVAELNFLGNPIDFVGFKGLDGDNQIEIKFIEVKSGRSKLNKNQQRIRNAVEEKRIEWVEVRLQEVEVVEKIIS